MQTTCMAVPIRLQALCRKVLWPATRRGRNSVLFRVAALLLLTFVAGSQAQAPQASGKPVTLAILHFSAIGGSTWSGAHDRAGKRLAEKYRRVRYVFREEVGADLTIPYAEELIKHGPGADIVIGNAEFMGLPLKNIADQYPRVYFGSVIASDITTKRNFIRFFPREYQAMYLGGLIAAALTVTGNVGIVSAFPNVQVQRRQAGFILGVQEAANILGKHVNVYIKYAGDWYKPAEEREIATALVTQSNVVGFFGWSSTDTVAVSFDTRWEVLYEHMILNWIAGNRHPQTLLYLGMADTTTLADGTVEAAVDIMNDNKIGVDAISPKAKPLIPGSILKLVAERRQQMMNRLWDPFQFHRLVSNGTGLELEGTPIPPKGTVVKEAGRMPADEWLLGKFNFDLDGVIILK